MLNLLPKWMVSSNLNSVLKFSLKGWHDENMMSIPGKREDDHNATLVVFKMKRKIEALEKGDKGRGDFSAAEVWCSQVTVRSSFVKFPTALPTLVRNGSCSHLCAARQLLPFQPGSTDLSAWPTEFGEFFPGFSSVQQITDRSTTLKQSGSFRMTNCFCYWIYA